MTALSCEMRSPISVCGGPTSWRLLKPCGCWEPLCMGHADVARGLIREAVSRGWCPTCKRPWTSDQLRVVPL